MTSINHSYEDIEEGSEQWDGLTVSATNKINLGRLKLPFLMEPEAVFDGLNRNAI
jgi:hypothetical protein